MLIKTKKLLIQIYQILLNYLKFKNGTERCQFTAEKINASKKDIIINLQADEFNINPNEIRKLIRLLKLSPEVKVATLFYETSHKNDYISKDQVKVIVDKQLKAITFTRKPITSIGSKYLIHIGVYAFTYESLKLYSTFKECHYEKEESLEQLRLIWNNVPIDCVQVKNNKSIGINSARDLKEAREYYDN